MLWAPQKLGDSILNTYSGRGIIVGLIAIFVGLGLLDTPYIMYSAFLLFFGQIIFILSLLILLLAFLKILLFKTSKIVKEKSTEFEKSLDTATTTAKQLVKTQRKDMENFLRWLKATPDEDIAELLILSSLARDGEPHLKSDDFLNNFLRMPKKKIRSVKANLQMEVMETQNLEGGELVHAGYTIWIMTLRAVEGIEYQLLAKEIWNEMRRGRPFLEMKLSNFEKQQGLMLTPLEKERASFIPKL